MARCGVGSRRYCENLISQNRVRVNGQATELGCKVTLKDRVTLDEKPLTIIREKIYIAINKPRKYLCSNFDRQGRPLVSELYNKIISTRLFHVGRLDFLSSGLIFYTNDGDFAKIVSHPSSGIEKEYLLETREAIPESVLLKYSRGIKIEGERFCLKKYVYKTPKKVLLTLEEGKNREIRRVCSHFNVVIRRIHRVRIGCVSIEDIPAGAYRHLIPKEVQWFFLNSIVKEQATW